MVKEASRWRKAGGQKRKTVWQDKTGRRFTGFVVAGDVLLAAGHPAGAGKPFLAAVNTTDGTYESRSKE